MRHDSASASAAGLTVVISGATGMIGSALTARLRDHGHTVRRLTRSASNPQAGDIVWDPTRGQLDARSLEGADAIVNLAGAPIAVRWTTASKRDIRDSRLRATDLIAGTIARLDRKPRVVLSGSAIGFYGNSGDQLLDEHGVAGKDFLASVVRDWEAAAAPLQGPEVRLVLLRTGIVLSKRGGALAKLLPPFRLGLGGPIGSGHQWMSWIALEDHIGAMEFAISHEALQGPVNVVAPNPVTNAEFATALGHVLSRPAVIPVPAFALELAFGEMAEATLLAGQRLAPRALETAGFEFRFPTIDQGLRCAIDS